MTEPRLYRNTGTQPVADTVTVVARYHCGKVSDPFQAAKRRWSIESPPSPFDIRDWRYADPGDDPANAAEQRKDLAA